MTVDYAYTDDVLARRAAKAVDLARLAWRHALTTPQFEHMAPSVRRAFVRAAGHRTASSTTWEQATARLDAMWVYSRDPAVQAPPQDLAGNALWDDDDAQPAPVDDVNQADELEAPAAVDATPVAPEDAPRGWAEACALGPLPRGETCVVCGAPAHVRTFDVHRCAQHPPLAGEWGHRLNYAPNPQATCAPLRCYCGRHTQPEDT